MSRACSVACANGQQRAVIPYGQPVILGTQCAAAGGPLWLSAQTSASPYLPPLDGVQAGASSFAASTASQIQAVRFSAVTPVSPYVNGVHYGDIVNVFASVAGNATLRMTLAPGSAVPQVLWTTQFGNTAPEALWRVGRAATVPASQTTVLAGDALTLANVRYGTPYAPVYLNANGTGTLAVPIAWTVKPVLDTPTGADLSCTGGGGGSVKPASRWIWIALVLVVLALLIALAAYAVTRPRTSAVTLTQTTAPGA